MSRDTKWQEGMIWQSQAKRRGYTPSSDKEEFDNRVRVRTAMVVGLVVIVVMWSRLFFLQIIEGERQRLFAENNHVELVREVADRGIIYDRNRVALVKNVLIEDDGKMVAVREYPYGASSSHIIGYMSEVKDEELGCRDGLCYSRGMRIGRSGVERLMEEVLRGKDGGRVVEYNAKGEIVQEVGTTTPSAGSEVVLSIDSRLQQIAYEAMNGRSGAVVALNMQGKVLALVSSPSYDPNLFSVRKDPLELTQALQDTTRQYFLNRAIAGSYAPGSVFKPVVAIAGLEEGVITGTEKIEDTGELRVDQYRYGNWYFDKYGKTEGMIDVVRALSRSNDIFFYLLGERIGVNKITYWARKFGIGEKTGIELLGESSGYLPTPLLKERRTGEKWYLGNTYHLSIGQGDLTATPLQIARMAVGVVSGRMCNVSILASSDPSCVDLGIKKENIQYVVRGMREACASGGTAYSFFDDAVPVLCKTGTAQHAGQKTESDLPHAWIMVATPAENPEMILTVFLDSAGEGSAEAGPVAKEIIDRWREKGN